MYRILPATALLCASLGWLIFTQSEPIIIAVDAPASPPSYENTEREVSVDSPQETRSVES